MQTSPEVDAWFAAPEQPQKVIMQAVREAILSADERVEECVMEDSDFHVQGQHRQHQPRGEAVR
jgi:hypothetical protein